MSTVVTSGKNMLLFQLHKMVNCGKNWNHNTLILQVVRITEMVRWLHLWNIRTTNSWHMTNSPKIRWRVIARKELKTASHSVTYCRRSFNRKCDTLVLLFQIEEQLLRARTHWPRSRDLSLSCTIVSLNNKMLRFALCCVGGKSGESNGIFLRQEFKWRIPVSFHAAFMARCHGLRKKWRYLVKTITYLPTLELRTLNLYTEYMSKQRHFTYCA